MTHCTATIHIQLKLSEEKVTVTSAMTHTSHKATDKHFPGDGILMNTDREGSWEDKNEGDKTLGLDAFKKVQQDVIHQIIMSENDNTLETESVKKRQPQDMIKETVMTL